MYKLNKLMGLHIEDSCNILINHRQRATSTINEIVLIKMVILDEIGSQKGRGR